MLDFGNIRKDKDLSFPFKVKSVKVLVWATITYAERWPLRAKEM